MIENLARRRLVLGTGAAFALAALPRRMARAADPIRFGLLLDLSSVFSEISGKGSETAVRMAVEDFGGQLLGRPIELLVVDHQTKADIAGAQARKWFDTENVEAILEVASTGPTIATIAVARDRNKLVITNGGGSASITNEACTPTTIQYSWNTNALARTLGQALTDQGGDSWFFMTVDYTFGHQLEADTAAVVKTAGGRVVGSTRIPLGTTDFSSYLLQARASGAKIIGLALAGADLVNALKQASEFGLGRPGSGQTLAALILLINDVHAIGLEIAQGTLMAAPFYWNLNPATRAFSQRFFSRTKRMPNYVQAGAYSSTLHYLKASQRAGTTNAATVKAAMRQASISDMFTPNGTIRGSGLMIHEMHLFRIKAPNQSREPWDYYDLVSTISGEKAFGSETESKCNLGRS